MHLPPDDSGVYTKCKQGHRGQCLLLSLAVAFSLSAGAHFYQAVTVGSQTDGSSSSSSRSGCAETDPYEKTDVSCSIMYSCLWLLERESTNFCQSNPAGPTVVYVLRWPIDFADGEPSARKVSHYS